MSKQVLGRTLSEKHRTEFRDSGIPDEMIERCGVYSANGEIKDILGNSPKHMRGWGDGWVLPFRSKDGDETEYHRVKLDDPRVGRNGKTTKYESPKGLGNRAYFPPGFAEAFAGAKTMLVVEGEKKSLKATCAGFCCGGCVGSSNPRRRASPWPRTGLTTRSRSCGPAAISTIASTPFRWSNACGLEAAPPGGSSTA